MIIKYCLTKGKQKEQYEQFFSSERNHSQKTWRENRRSQRERKKLDDESKEEEKAKEATVQLLNINIQNYRMNKANNIIIIKKTVTNMNTNGEMVMATTV